MHYIHVSFIISTIKRLSKLVTSRSGSNSRSSNNHNLPSVPVSETAIFALTPPETSYLHTENTVLARYRGAVQEREVTRKQLPSKASPNYGSPNRKVSRGEVRFLSGILNCDASRTTRRSDRVIWVIGFVGFSAAFAKLGEM